jgi:uncharacterized protein YdgA (DUF945 family)
MHKAAIAAGSLIVLLLGAPWVAGALTQRQFVADVARIESAERFHVEVVDYDRGWTTTTARVAVGLSPSQLAAIEGAVADLEERPAAIDRLHETIPLRVTMRHGPVVLGAEPGVGIMATTIVIDPEAQGLAELTQELGVEQLFELNARTSFGGVSDYVAAIPALELARDDLDLTYSGLRVAGSYDGPSRHLTSAAEPSSLSVSLPGSSFAMENFEFSSDTTRFNPHFWLGTSQGSADRVMARNEIQQQGAEATRLAARFDVTLDEAGEHLSLAADYSADGLSAGEALAVSDIVLAMAVSGLEVQALTEYVELSQGVGTQADAAAPVQLALEDIVYRLLQGSPVIDVSALRFLVDDEPVDASLRIAVDGPGLPPRPVFTVMNPLLFASLVSIDATLALSEPLATWVATQGMMYQLQRSAAANGEPIPETDLEAMAQLQAGVVLAGLVAQGMLDSTDAGYAAQARFAGGELTLNGTPVPLGF